MTAVRLPDDARSSVSFEIAEGTTIFRCHSCNYPGAKFYSGSSAGSRFTPLISPLGEEIATLYAAETADAAVFETVLRFEGTPVNSFPLSEFQQTSMSHIKLKRKMLLVPLFSAELRT